MKKAQREEAWNEMKRESEPALWFPTGSGQRSVGSFLSYLRASMLFVYSVEEAAACPLSLQTVSGGIVDRVTRCLRRATLYSLGRAW